MRGFTGYAREFAKLVGGRVPTFPHDDVAIIDIPYHGHRYPVRLMKNHDATKIAFTIGRPGDGHIARMGYRKRPQPDVLAGEVRALIRAQRSTRSARRADWVGETTATVRYQLGTYSGEITIPADPDEDSEDIIARARAKLRKMTSMPMYAEHYEVVSRGDD